MTVNELIHLYDRAWAERPAIFGLPGGELSPAEQAGELVRQHGLEGARAVARQRAADFPAPWSFYHQVLQVLEGAREG
jgi:hypothetical protein